jgi:hypothetical protein
MEKRKIKDIFGLEYETENLQYGIPAWYNELLDKSLDELTNTDLGRMIRQKVLKQIAIEKVIERVIVNPFDGEYEEADLLEKLVDNFEDVARNNRINELVSKIQEAKDNIDSYEWDEYVPEDKKDFEDKLIKFLQKAKAMETNL